MKVTVTKEITNCYHECPYVLRSGVPGPVPLCSHPDASSPFIITFPEAYTGFPAECPLIKKLDHDKKDDHDSPVT